MPFFKPIIFSPVLVSRHLTLCHEIGTGIKKHETPSTAPARRTQCNVYG
jgi:hypothetical protein